MAAADLADIAIISPSPKLSLDGCIDRGMKNLPVYLAGFTIQALCASRAEVCNCQKTRAVQLIKR
jgi:hypothetical protein